MPPGGSLDLFRGRGTGRPGFTSALLRITSPAVSRLAGGTRTTSKDLYNTCESTLPQQPNKSSGSGYCGSGLGSVLLLINTALAPFFWARPGIWVNSRSTLPLPALTLKLLFQRDFNQVVSRQCRETVHPLIVEPVPRLLLQIPEIKQE